MDTALKTAVENGHTKVARWLVARGGEPNWQHKLHECCKAGDLDGIRDVVQHGMEQLTAVHTAATNGHMHVARQLVEHGDFVDAEST